MTMKARPTEASCITATRIPSLAPSSRYIPVVGSEQQASFVTDIGQLVHLPHNKEDRRGAA